MGHEVREQVRLAWWRRHLRSPWSWRVSLKQPQVLLCKGFVGKPSSSPDLAWSNRKSKSGACRNFRGATASSEVMTERKSSRTNVVAPCSSQSSFLIIGELVCSPNPSPSLRRRVMKVRIFFFDKRSILDGHEDVCEEGIQFSNSGVLIEFGRITSVLLLGLCMLDWIFHLQTFNHDPTQPKSP